MHGGHSVVHRNQVTMHLPFHSIHIPVDLGRTNLPVVHDSFVTEHKNRAIGPQMRSSLGYSIILNLDIFGDLNTIRSLQDMDISVKQTKIEHESDNHHSHFFGTYIGAPAIKNLSVPQKYLLLYHWKLRVSM